jgi:NAD(P)H-nitrite reductase large subunit
MLIMLVCFGQKRRGGEVEKRIIILFLVMAAGITPANQLAVAGELEIDTVNGGIVVNPEFQIRSDLYAVLSSLSFYLPFSFLVGIFCVLY